MQNHKTMIIACVLLVCFNFAVADEGSKAKLEIGADAPTFFLRDLDGENFFLSRSLKQNKPIVISFFANWCIPCRTEIPAYEKILAMPDYAGVELVYIHVGEPKAPKGDSVDDITLIRKVVDELGMTHPILYDRYGVVSEKYFAASLPTSVLISPAGKISYYHTGYKPGDEKQMVSVLKTLVSKK